MGVLENDTLTVPNMSSYKEKLTWMGGLMYVLTVREEYTIKLDKIGFITIDCKNQKVLIHRANKCWRTVDHFCKYTL